MSWIYIYIYIYSLSNTIYSIIKNQSNSNLKLFIKKHKLLSICDFIIGNGVISYVTRK